MPSTTLAPSARCRLRRKSLVTELVKRFGRAARNGDHHKAYEGKSDAILSFVLLASFVVSLRCVRMPSLPCHMNAGRRAIVVGSAYTCRLIDKLETLEAYPAWINRR